MKRISNFKDFVNESYISKALKTAKDWASSFIKNLQDGIIRLIPSGMKAGKPVAVLFDGDNGSISDQLLNFYKGTPYAEKIEEAKVPLEYPRKDDVLNVGVDELKKMLKTRMKAVIRANGDEKAILDIKPFFIYGAPGIGKTMIVAQVLDELKEELSLPHGLNLHCVDGEFAEPVDFAGVPSVVDIEGPSEQSPFGKGVTRSNVSVNLLPADNGPGDAGGIIFIDEINRMDKEVVKVFMKLAQSRRLGASYTIPPKWYIVAAGNRKEDDPTTVKDLGTALRDRFSIVNYVPSTKSWTKHVTESPKLKNVVLPELIDFFEFTDDYFHNLDPSKGLAKFPTPRAWVDASFGLKQRMEELEEEGVTKISPDEIRKMFQLEVGSEAAGAFVDFYNLVSEINIKDVIKVFTEAKTAPLPKRGGGACGYDAMHTHAWICAIIKKSKELEITESLVRNFIDYLLRLNCPEFGNAALSSFTKTHMNIIKKNPEMVDMVTDLGDQWSADIDFE